MSDDELQKVNELEADIEKENKSKLPEMTVIWSGGFDSTALIIKYLEEGRMIHPISVSLSNNKDQARSEKLARENIQKLLMEEFPGKLYRNQEFQWPEITHAKAALPQPPIWLYMAALNSPTNDVALGWVQTDCVWHYHAFIHKLVEMFDAFKGEKTVLHLPFEWCKKEALLAYYVRRPHVFHALSTSEVGMPWTLGNDDKCKELKKLSKKLKKMLYEKGSHAYPSSTDEAHHKKSTKEKNVKSSFPELIVHQTPVQSVQMEMFIEPTKSPSAECNTVKCS